MARDQSAREASASAQPGAEAGSPGRQYVPQQAPRYGAPGEGAGPGGATMGLTLFAAVVMMMSGFWNFLEGLAAVIRGSFFVTLPNYAFDLSVSSWGWFHLILGVVVAMAGVGLLTDRVWARVVGVVVVAISMIVNFLYIPYQPVWSIVVVALDLAVLWALITPRDGWS
jgi:hypothetical protein